LRLLPNRYNVRKLDNTMISGGIVPVKPKLSAMQKEDKHGLF
jgi:hypothetical protein